MESRSVARATGLPKPLMAALGLNFLWINASEIWRYFYVVRPMLKAEYSDAANVAPMNLPIFLSWTVWDSVLILAATSFYWIWYGRFGAGYKQVAFASAAFTVTVFGLIWLGVANMGLASYRLLVVATPLAFLEQFVAAFIVKRTQPTP